MKRHDWTALDDPIWLFDSLVPEEQARLKQQSSISTVLRNHI
jgi:hypothetical protein